MKKTLFLLMIFVFTLCAFPAYAATSDSATDQVISVSSTDSLQRILNSRPGADSLVTVRLESTGSPYQINGTRPISIPDNVTLDLNGQTVTSDPPYAFNIQGTNASIMNGTIKSGGIRVTNRDTSTTGTISGVTLQDPQETGIYLNGSAIGDITGNTINNAGYIGLRLFSGSSSGDITDNTISKSADHAISLNGSSSASTNNGSSAGDITGNIITGCKGHGISLYHGSHCGKINNNQLTSLGGAHHDVGDYAITVNSGCAFETYASEIISNKIDGITFAGIVVHSAKKGKESSAAYGKAYVKGDIAYNTVKNAATYTKNKECQAAIYVDSYATIYGAIHHNKVQNCYDDGICVLKNSYVGKIYSNTVKNIRNYGISAKGNSSIGQVTGNTISMKNARKGMGVFSNTGCHIGKISGNKITGKYTVGIRIIAAKKKVTITSNKMVSGNPSSVQSRGISANNCSNLVIKKNKITGNKTGPGIYIPHCKASVSGNVIKKSTRKVSR